MSLNILLTLRQEVELLQGTTVKWIAFGLTALSAAFIIYLTLKAFEDRGASKMREAVANQNKEAANAGEAARLNLHDCVSRGMQFDFVTGKCGR